MLPIHRHDCIAAGHKVVINCHGGFLSYQVIVAFTGSLEMLLTILFLEAPYPSSIISLDYLSTSALRIASQTLPRAKVPFRCTSGPRGTSAPQAVAQPIPIMVRPNSVPLGLKPSVRPSLLSSNVTATFAILWGIFTASSYLCRSKERPRPRGPYPPSTPTLFALCLWLLALSLLAQFHPE